ncbi:hypothetical protein QZJ86_19995 [Methylomonas montana]|uniref:hypothetical protein n=1 Tax=Methylomonas montana TaxID=3058963 RepID=UPI002658B372|nr:hypothetical protein [Methylomonas montana]WKJ90264.1 hypothetical protein QZJ86_19995 [Methylomonas montana]
MTFVTDYCSTTRYALSQANKTEVCVMSAAAIDRNALNGLFDNQRKLDDLFDSIFDDDNYFINSVSSSPTENFYVASSATRSITAKKSRVRESVLTIKEQCPYFFVLPIVLEIAAIYLVAANFW